MLKPIGSTGLKKPRKCQNDIHIFFPTTGWRTKTLCRNWSRSKRSCSDPIKAAFVMVRKLCKLPTGIRRCRGKDCVFLGYCALSGFGCFCFFFYPSNSVEETTRAPQIPPLQGKYLTLGCSAFWFFLWFDSTYHAELRWLRVPSWTDRESRGECGTLEL